ncbi:MAG: sigma 54-interacting transcriptional regulator [Chromatiales bacterium]|nr:sigma 54-interacting transcriptional regulator [Chromatiales bacterium]
MMPSLEGQLIDRKTLLELFRPLMDPIVEGVIVTNRAGALLACNTAVHRLFDLPPEGRPHSLGNLNGFNLRTALIKAGLEVEEPDKSRHHCEMSVEFDQEISVTGVPRWLRISTALVGLPGDEEPLRLIVLRDITAEKRLFATMSAKEACGVATEDPEMLRLIERLNIVAGSDASVLMQGESGTGKTELARLVHERSRRAQRPFVEVNCGAIPASLIESELFGHVKGAFTGALKDRPGRFKSADGGTLFLDEIGELPRELQPKLLRVLQDGEFEPVGSDRTQRADVRVVAASNRDLREMVDKGDFRADLFYRIAVVPLHVPALRERPGDIQLLIRVIMKRLAQRGYPGNIGVSTDAMRAFMNYPWPGNVRELANAVEHALICARDGMIDSEALPYALREYCSARVRAATSAMGDDSRSEREIIEDALRKSQGQKTLAAQLLGIDRSTLWRRMQRLGMG